ncbi:MAG: hypothetical protein ACYTHJ_16425 [Planctomycetota bacterium]|jgi:hypothetical protein
MTSENPNDKQFHDNLRRLGDALPAPETPGAEALQRCRDALHQNTDLRRKGSFWRRPAIWSSLGMAAAIAMIIGFLGSWSSAPRVEAAEIIRKLNEQMAENPLIEVKIEGLRADDVVLEAQLLVAEDAVAGDLKIEVQPGTEDAIDIDMTMGISGSGGWALFRELQIADPEAAAMLAMFFPVGRDTLVILPEDVIGEDGDFSIDIQEAISTLASEEIAALMEQLQESQDELGATVEELPDGTLQFTLPIADEDVLGQIGAALEAAGTNLGRDDDGNDDDGNTVNITIGTGVGSDHSGTRKSAPADSDGLYGGMTVNARKKHSGNSGGIVIDREVQIDTGNARQEDEGHDAGDGDEFLIGTTLRLIYDPNEELVREIFLSDFGDNNGTLSIVLRDGAIDPALLDSDNFMGKNTHVLDLGAIMKAFGG